MIMIRKKDPFTRFFHQSSHICLHLNDSNQCLITSSIKASLLHAACGTFITYKHKYTHTIIIHNLLSSLYQHDCQSNVHSIAQIRTFCTTDAHLLTSRHIYFDLLQISSTTRKNHCCTESVVISYPNNDSKRFLQISVLHSDVFTTN